MRLSYVNTSSGGNDIMSLPNSSTYLESLNRALIKIVKFEDWVFNKDKRYDFNEESRATLWHRISLKLSEKGFNLLGEFSLRQYNFTIQ